MAFSFTGCVNEGQPVPDSNFSEASKSSVPQQRQPYRPGSNKLHISELNARSVPPSRVTRNCSGLNWSRHSAGVFSIRESGFALPFRARLRTSFHLSMILFSDKNHNAIDAAIFVRYRF